jgi:hypothetical protein
MTRNRTSAAAAVTPAVVSTLSSSIIAAVLMGLGLILLL